MTTKLIGNTKPSAGCWDKPGWVFLQQTVLVSGDCHELDVYTASNVGLVKGAVYSDLGGEPDILLAYSTVNQSLTNEWVTLKLNTSIAMTTGQTYWLGLAYSSGRTVCAGAPASYTERWLWSKSFSEIFPTIAWASWEWELTDDLCPAPLLAGYDISYDPYLPVNFMVPICIVTAAVLPASSGQGTDEHNHSLLSVTEKVNNLSTSTLDIVFNNYDGFFDNAGVGQLDVLAVGSRVRLFLGYDIETIDPKEIVPHGKEYEETSRYFVDSWSYNRTPNLTEFILHCIDAWGLLEKYRFNRKVSFNYPGATTTYSVYELIEMLCLAIGGSLSYISRSSYITIFKPVIEVNAGENAANLLRRLLTVVPDVIRFIGNEGYMVYPQTGDKSTYNLKFPIT